MRLRPRHYLLIAVILALGAFNLYRSRHARSGAVTPVANTSATVASPTPPQAAAAWAAFDKAAGLRDAPGDRYSPAAAELQHQIDIAQPASVVIDVKGCQTWLEFYRQSVVHPSRDTSWRDRSVTHLNACVTQHADAG